MKKQYSGDYDGIKAAYIQMAKVANYRPAAPGDGMGNVDLTKDEEESMPLLEKEAHEYTEHFLEEEDNREFFMGCSNGETNKAFVYAIESARLLACGSSAQSHALRLLTMAKEEVMCVMLLNMEKESQHV